MRSADTAKILGCIRQQLDCLMETLDIATTYGSAAESAKLSAASNHLSDAIVLIGQVLEPGEEAHE